MLLIHANALNGDHFDVLDAEPGARSAAALNEAPQVSRNTSLVGPPRTEPREIGWHLAGRGWARACAARSL